MKNTSLLLTLIFLVGCAARGNINSLVNWGETSGVPLVQEAITEEASALPERGVVEEGASGDATSEVVRTLSDTQKPLEALPAELSISYFKKMRLEGRDLALGDVLAVTDVYTRYAITYRSNGLLISGVMNIPQGEGPFPLVILNHGYIDRAVYVRGRGLKREQDYLARAGFAVLHTDYRGHAGSDESPMTANVYDGNLEYAMDSANAILAVRKAELPQVDAEHVGMLGHSLGGGITLTILTGRPDLVNAAVLYAPIHADVFLNFMRWRERRNEGDRTLAVFGTREEHPEVWDALSPQTFLSDIEVPVLLFQGDRDKDVPKEWSDHLAMKLEEAGKEITYIEYEGEGHEFGPKWTDFMEKTVAFFRQRL